MKADYLVIGTGLAGLNFIIQANKIDPNRRIIVVTKSTPEESNTSLAQGGIAIVNSPNDSFEKHIQDTLIAGDGACDEKIVRMVIESGPSVLEELIQMGAEFDRTEEGDLDLGKEGGHSEHRIIHAKDITGHEIGRCLINVAKKLPNVTLLKHHFCVDLVTSDNTCYGALVMNEATGEHLQIQARITFLATGGIGQVYSSTTNPSVATGDGIAIAHRANALISDMEFIQFHPTALKSKTGEQQFLISEALRGFGAFLCLDDGISFMENYHHQGSLACRDIVCRAIVAELSEKEIDHVYLNCKDCEPLSFDEHFPNIKNKCLSEGIDPLTQLIPVGPTQHYLCGGISTDQHGQTTISRLFAAGECARTGLHGANRLASNSLLEAFVFSKNCALKSAEIIADLDYIQLPDNKAYADSFDSEKIDYSRIRKEVQDITWNSVGIIRNTKELSNAMNQLSKISSDLKKYSAPCVEYYELTNLVLVATLIVSSSLKNTENKGSYYNSDLLESAQ